jgi:subtilisin family serine protease
MEVPMAQEKDERPNAALKKPGEAGEDQRRTPGSAGRGGARETAAADSAVTAPPGRRRERYLIGTRSVSGGQPFGYPPPSMDDVVGYLGRLQNVEIVKRIKLGSAQPFTDVRRGGDEVVVAKIEESKAQWLKSVAPPHLIIERDAPLACADYVPGWATPIGTRLPLRADAMEMTIRVTGERDQPLAGATVVIDGGGLPVQAVTDETGTARLNFYGGTFEEIRALFVRPASNHWDRVIFAPRLGAGTSTVRLRPLAELYPNFPNERLLGWGLRLMGIEPAKGRFSGSGVKIGVIDSGCDNSHPLLRHVTRGVDFTGRGPDTTSWTQDPIAHGTHCSGILGAASASSAGGIVGCVPEAELHVLKVIPGGRVSDLLAALEECIERELDLVNISVVIDGSSELVAQKLQEAHHKGIACIAAAGNTGGAVAFPATLPVAMAVAAIGRLRQFPADSSHALAVAPHLVGSDGIFAASFSSNGPQVAISAPGVAILSTVPGGGYAAADGTSAAAAHVTGFAALVLAHHPLFHEESYRARSGQRVHALFELLRASAVPRLGDPLRDGAGVPELTRVPGRQSLAAGTMSSGAAQRAAMMGMPSYWPGQMGVWPPHMGPAATPGFY